ncbi:MAG: hypothetical protein E3J72_21735 [Planctomycetota bacterium]|nr:MAG: hypothetical protein E3J72_21735 [Planctomycetota bacterium]
MKFTVPLILSIIVVTVAIIIGATILRGSWGDLDEKSRFGDYRLGHYVTYIPSCAKGVERECHNAKDPREYYVDQIKEWGKSRFICPRKVEPDEDPDWPGWAEFDEAIEERENFRNEPVKYKKLIGILNKKLSELRIIEEKAEELYEQADKLEEDGNEKEAEKLLEEAEEQEKLSAEWIHKSLMAYLLNAASPTKEDAENRKKENQKEFRFVKFVGYEAGMELVKEKNLPYIIELSMPFEI